MEVGEREEFDLLFDRLRAAHGIPPDKSKQDAYFANLSKMSLGRFSECVDFACGEEGPEKFPSSKAIWRIHRQLLKRLRAPQLPQRVEPPRADNLQHLANRRLLEHITARGGLGSTGRWSVRGMVNCVSSEELLACRRFANGLARDFAGFVREGDELATPAEFLRQFMHGLARVSPLEAACREMWSEWLHEAKARLPFALSMADIAIEGEFVL